MARKDIRRSDYRVMVPIGLTVESFSPFSAYCKELPQVEPLLGKHAFISLSIDDLFVLKRFLPTPGSFAHYMEVRQAVAGIRQAHLFDELDHLGAYLKKNRFDQDIADQLKGGKVNMLIWDGMSDIIDRSFEGARILNTLCVSALAWNSPSQKLLDAGFQSNQVAAFAPQSENAQVMLQGCPAISSVKTLNSVWPRCPPIKAKSQAIDDIADDQIKRAAIPALSRITSSSTEQVSTSLLGLD